MKIKTGTTAVVVVDVQGDFTQVKSGSLAVAGTDQAYLDQVIDATRFLKENGLKLFATQDCHPADHVSFFTNHDGVAVMDVVDIDGRSQVMWPPHCVENTPGAEVLVDDALFEAIVPKGNDSRYDSYSGFFDDGGGDTGLAHILSQQGITDLIIYGLATDYCVKATALDALQSGFRVVLLQDLCRGVAPETTEAALADMQDRGVAIRDVADLVF
ncbi:MAG: isochorismatase family protein [Desulfobacteraceae bacterium]|nr:MAG: isochorismatase family protein [Desulfobacteraceae bacterium]